MHLTNDRSFVRFKRISEYLYLDENQLTGTIPKSMGALTTLETLYLQKNRLSGVIPESLDHLKHLKELKLHENDLTGSVPSKVCKLTTQTKSELILLSADCKTEVNCTCCTECF
jgi:Leucine-rich repeat (LRR) protein